MAARLPHVRTGTLLLALGLAGCGGDAPGPRPASYGPDGALRGGPAEGAWRGNVLLVSIDTLRADHLGCYGHERPTSPRIDALAAEGVVFERAFSCSPWTTPAHVSMMTSLYPSVHQVLDYPQPGRLDARAVTLAEILRQQGFRTAAFTEGGYARGDTGLDQGFEVFPGWADAEEGAEREGASSRLLENAERALGWLEEHAGEDFFLFFHTYEPHFPYSPPFEAFLRLAPDFDADAERRSVAAAVESWNARRELTPEEKGALCRHLLQGDLHRFGVRRPKELAEMFRSFTRYEWQRSPSFAADLEYVRTLYDAEILFADEVVGRLLDRLRELGVHGRTLVVLTSDHGEGLMDHGFLDHGENLYEELLHVPLIVRFPDGTGVDGTAAGTRHAEPVRTIDILPTLLERLGLPALEEAQGVSLLAALRGEGAPPPSLGEAVNLIGRERDLLSLRDARWKYHYYAADGGKELYDLAADPGERTNLAAAHPDVAAEMHAALEGLRRANEARARRYVAEERAFSDAERERLEALGYAGSEER